MDCSFSTALRAQIQIASALLFAVTAADVAACSCYPVHLLLEKDAAGLRRMRDHADHVVHARVAKVLDSDEAEIEILESFKPSSPPLRTVKAQRGDDATCGRGPFSNGEEGIFFVSGGSVNLCSKYGAGSPLIDNLRKLGQ
jgi:hypothetical protein